nr:cysteine-rich RLK (receptor-like protein kinase) 8 [Tanacetum cinerariifolium]
MAGNSSNNSSNSNNSENNPPNDEINSNHPLYLHQTDHPGLILISKRLTGPDNYSSWKRSFMIALNAKNKMKIITGEFILNTLREQIRNNLNFINSAVKLWLELQECYAQIDGHRIYQLSNVIVQLKQENSSVEMYYQKLKGLWDEFDALEAPYLCLCVCSCANRRINGERDQRKRLIQFLMGLDECYSNIKGQILLMQYLPTAAKAYTMVTRVEKQREDIAHKSTSSTILNSYTSKYASQNNHSYPKHNVPNTPNSRFTSQRPAQTGFERRSNFRKGVYCGNYGKEGHLQEECYKIIRYPVGHPLYGKVQRERLHTAKTFDLVWIWLGGDYGNVFLMGFVGIQWYALTVKPTVYVCHLRQFWSTARIETMEEGTKILATVD